MIKLVIKINKYEHKRKTRNDAGIKKHQRRNEDL